MIKVAIIGMGNVAWNVHLPVLLSRDDIEISWVFDKSQNKKNILKKKNIPFFNNIKNAINYKKCDIALITIPYSERVKIFDEIKDKFSGIFFEKPFALTLDQHKYFSNYYEDYAVTIGYQRRHMGIVKNLKNIINQNIFGPLISIKINFGDIHYKFDGFRSKKEKSGGGIFFEAGSHWIDTVLFVTDAKNIKNFKSYKKEMAELDIECNGAFDIINKHSHEINCNFYISNLDNTSNSIEFNFKHCSLELSLFDDNSSLKIINNGNHEFIIKDNEFSNFPNNSLDVLWSFWNEFLYSYKNKKKSEISADNFVLTTKIIELFYAK
jgi:predicted dehydrogenase